MWRRVFMLMLCLALTGQTWAGPSLMSCCPPADSPPATSVADAASPGDAIDEADTADHGCCAEQAATGAAGPGCMVDGCCQVLPWVGLASGLASPSQPPPSAVRQIATRADPLRSHVPSGIWRPPSLR